MASRVAASLTAISRFGHLAREVVVLQARRPRHGCAGDPVETEGGAHGRQSSLIEPGVSSSSWTRWEPDVADGHASTLTATDGYP